MKHSENAEMSVQIEFIRKFVMLFDNELPISLVRACVRSIAQNDLAHNLGHVFSVCKLGEEICDTLKLSKDERMKVRLGCLFHDLGCRYNRDDHHLIAYGLCYTMLEEFWPERFTPDEIKDIAVAVLEHRSSSKGKPSSLISEVVSIADSGKPDIDTYIKRSLQFRISRGDLDGREPVLLFNEVWEHLIDKFGRNGYHWNSYPELGLNFYRDDWDEFTYFLEGNPGDEFPLNPHDKGLERIEEIFNKL